MTANVRQWNLLTVQEAAALLRQSERSIRRKIHSGELAAVRLGEHGPLRVDERGLEEFLEPVDSSPAPGADPVERRAPDFPAVEARAHSGEAA